MLPYEQNIEKPIKPFSSTTHQFPNALSLSLSLCAMAPPPTMKAMASLLLLTLIMLTTSEWSPIPAAQASAVTPRFGPLSRILLPMGKILIHLCMCMYVYMCVCVCVCVCLSIHVLLLVSNASDYIALDDDEFGVDCPGSCNVRCSLAGVAKRCIRYCMICCNQCQCVPPGTVGNKEVCPCYNNWKTQQGGPKCP